MHHHHFWYCFDCCSYAMAAGSARHEPSLGACRYGPRLRKLYCARLYCRRPVGWRVMVMLARVMGTGQVFRLGYLAGGDSG